MVVVLAWLVAVAVSGCATLPSPSERAKLANDIAHSAGMTKRVIEADGFLLLTYQRVGAPGKPLHVYIEGDGLAWLSRRRVSDDPTPIDPLALRLAAEDPAENVAYLARPCQYILKSERRRCTSALWTTQRFSKDVIAASDQAIDELLRRSGSSALLLTGYSGGGAVAALVAARRHDVMGLRTVAGNLDPATFTALHGVTPLTGSLNPVSFGEALATIPQRHFVGADDDIVPIAVAKAYVDHLSTQRCVTVSIVPHATHGDGWVERWKKLQTLPVTCKKQ